MTQDVEQKRCDRCDVPIMSRTWDQLGSRWIETTRCDNCRQFEQQQAHNLGCAINTVEHQMSDAFKAQGTLTGEDAQAWKDIAKALMNAKLYLDEARTRIAHAKSPKIKPPERW